MTMEMTTERENQPGTPRLPREMNERGLLEHLRQHERVTLADKELQDRVNSFNAGSEPPCVSHFFVRDNPEAKSPKPNNQV